MDKRCAQRQQASPLLSSPLWRYQLCGCVVLFAKRLQKCWRLKSEKQQYLSLTLCGRTVQLFLCNGWSRLPLIVTRWRIQSVRLRLYGCYQETKNVLTAVHVKNTAAAMFTVGITLLTERLELAEKYNWGSTEVNNIVTPASLIHSQHPTWCSCNLGSKYIKQNVAHWVYK